MSILGDYLVTNVSFGQDGIRIEYMEQRFQTEAGGVENALVLFEMDEEKVGLVREIQAALSDIIEDYFANLPDRNPPDVLPNNRFLRKRGEPGDGEGTSEEGA
jgi:hypothetical protein